MVILIATSKADGLEWLHNQPAPPRKIVVVTPRSPRAARGVEADSILATPAAIRHSRYQDLVAEAIPAVLSNAVAG